MAIAHGYNLRFRSAFLAFCTSEIEGLLVCFTEVKEGLAVPKSVQLLCIGARTRAVGLCRVTPKSTVIHAACLLLSAMVKSLRSQ